MRGDDEALQWKRSQVQDIGDGAVLHRLLGGRKVQTFPQMPVEPMGYGVQFSLGIAGQVCSLRQGLSRSLFIFLFEPQSQGTWESAKKTRMASR